jgi:hypothetical protein
VHAARKRSGTIATSAGDTTTSVDDTSEKLKGSIVVDTSDRLKGRTTDADAAADADLDADAADDAAAAAIAEANAIEAADAVAVADDPYGDNAADTTVVASTTNDAEADIVEAANAAADDADDAAAAAHEAALAADDVNDFVVAEAEATTDADGEVGEKQVRARKTSRPMNKQSAAATTEAVSETAGPSNPKPRSNTNTATDDSDTDSDGVWDDVKRSDRVGLDVTVNVTAVTETDELEQGDVTYDQRIAAVAAAVAVGSATSKDGGLKLHRKLGPGAGSEAVTKGAMKLSARNSDDEVNTAIADDAAVATATPKLSYSSSRATGKIENAADREPLENTSAVSPEPGAKKGNLPVVPELLELPGLPTGSNEGAKDPSSADDGGGDDTIDEVENDDANSIMGAQADAHAVAHHAEIVDVLEAPIPPATTSIKAAFLGKAANALDAQDAPNVKTNGQNNNAGPFTTVVDKGIASGISKTRVAELNTIKVPRGSAVATKSKGTPEFLSGDFKDDTPTSDSEDADNATEVIPSTASSSDPKTVTAVSSTTHVSDADAGAFDRGVLDEAPLSEDIVAASNDSTNDAAVAPQSSLSPETEYELATAKDGQDDADVGNDSNAKQSMKLIKSSPNKMDDAAIEMGNAVASVKPSTSSAASTQEGARDGDVLSPVTGTTAGAGLASSVETTAAMPEGAIDAGDKIAQSILDAHAIDSSGALEASPAKTNSGDSSDSK